jgi:predicted PurR-regulated permease PerM
VGTPINLIYNESISPSYKILIDLQEALANETHWVKLPYITSDMQDIIDFISNTPKPVAPNDFKIWKDHPISVTTIAIIGTLILVIIVLIFFIYNKKKMGGTTNQITISMPSMKELEARTATREGY